jgi:GNAT superfamily N-acetyltransferase
VRVLERDLADLSAYGRVPISFLVRERYELIGRSLRGPIPVDPHWLKDYDADPQNRPDRFPRRFDVANWASFEALDRDRMLGGAIASRATSSLVLLEGRDDLVHLMDLRVLPEARQSGVGTGLWAAVEAWAIRKGSLELHVETQDINVPACKFYQKMGCHLIKATKDAYGPDYDEVQLIWGKNLRTPG